MYCEKCGTKNSKDSKFCGSCGHKIADLEKQIKKTDKIKELPKKSKIVMGLVLIITVISIIVLSILLSNPVKKIEDSLEKYYKNYSPNNNKELVEIGKILKNNKDNEKILTNIKETTHKIMEKWVKNFNIEYPNKEELLNNYNKVSGALKDIYNYYNGLEYMLNKELYNKYYEELQKLNSSKMSYLKGEEYENKNDSYNTYYNYSKVIENDCYYKKASNYVNNYVSDEMKKFKEKAEEFIKINDDSTNIEIYNCYVEELKYITANKISNYIDLSSTEDYKNLYKNVITKIVEYTKKIVEEYEKNEDYETAIKTIESSIKLLERDSNEYKELENLKKVYEDKIPVKLVSKNHVSKSSYASTSSWGKKIAGEDYENYISFAFVGETQNITYHLNKEYKKLKTKIVRGEDWDESITGYFIITGDGNEIYKSQEITKSSELNADIDINVSEVSDLKIEFVTNSKSTTIWNNSYIYLVEPYLYK